MFSRKGCESCIRPNSLHFLLQDEDFVAKNDDGSSQTNDLGEEEYDASESGNDFIYLDPSLDS